MNTRTWVRTHGHNRDIKKYEDSRRDSTANSGVASCAQFLPSSVSPPAAGTSCFASLPPILLSSASCCQPPTPDPRLYPFQTLLLRPLQPLLDGTFFFQLIQTPSCQDSLWALWQQRSQNTYYFNTIVTWGSSTVSKSHILGWILEGCESWLQPESDTSSPAEMCSSLCGLSA